MKVLADLTKLNQRFKMIVSGAALTMLFITLSSVGVLAHNPLGGKWVNGSVIRWYYYGGQLFINNLAEADDYWNAGQGEVLFLHTTNSSWRDIAVKDISDVDGDYWAYSWNFICSGCTYTSGEIVYNPYWIFGDSLSDGMKTKVSSHELGHVTGLGHVDSGYSSPAVMKQGYLNYKEPKPHDFDDFNAIY